MPVQGTIHISGPPSRQLVCCRHGRSHTRSPGVPIMRVNSQEIPLSAIPLCQLLPRFQSTCMSQGVLTLAFSSPCLCLVILFSCCASICLSICESVHPSVCQRERMAIYWVDISWVLYIKFTIFCQ